MLAPAGKTEIFASAVSPDFERALTREVLRTELVRVKALILTGLLILFFLSGVLLFDPAIEERIWHGKFGPRYVFPIVSGFILFECWVYFAISRHLKRGGDLPIVRRYLGALVETSVPSFILMMQIHSMGASPALGFVMPLVYFIFIILSTLRLDFWLSSFTGAVAALELLLLALFYHPGANMDAEPEVYYHGSRSLILFVCGLLAGSVGSQLRRQFAASIEAATARDRVTNLFGQHVSPEVVERLMAEGTGAAGDLRQVAVMFVDFRSFTSGARLRSPREVVERLDGAFAVLVEILDRHGGIVNKFLGDGFLALFGAPLAAPDAAGRAVAAGRDMLAAMERINAGSPWPLQIGIGIHFGEVVAGSIGSPRRKEYTVIGDTVNFAARLEALNKEYGSELLISSAVRETIGDAAQDAVALGEVAVRGYDRPVTIWRLG